MQTYLRGDVDGSNIVNFVAELVEMTQKMAGRMGGEDWIELQEQAWNTLSELCQGSQDSQKEALDAQVISGINRVMGHTTSKESEVGKLTDLKRAVLSLLEAFLEQNNDVAITFARQIEGTLNLGASFVSVIFFNPNIV